MILRPKPSLPHHGTFAVSAATSPSTSAPSWLRRAVPDAQSLSNKNVEDVALIAGAALDAVVRRQERWGGAWPARIAA
jgi:hypothetical protein